MTVGKQDKVAVLGLGIIGSRAFGRLRDAGWNAVCWNRTPKRMEGECPTAAEAVDDAKVVSLYLRDSEAARQVVGGLRGVLKPGQVVLNHSTLDLETVKWLESACGAAGCGFLDAPFTGSKVAAGNGDLVYSVGGDEDLLGDLSEFLSVTSKQVLHCGEVGAATVVKLATNLISASIVQAMAEALAITVGNGVAAEKLVEAVGSNVNSSVLTSMKFPQMLSGDYETHFSLTNMRKDTCYMLALAKSAGVETPAIAAVSKRMAALCDAGLADLDFAALAKPYLES